MRIFDFPVPGRSGWLPLGRLAAHAHGIGFVDVVSPESLPLAERYRGKPVKSLALCAIELALGESARLIDGELRLGERKLKNIRNASCPVTYPRHDTLKSLDFNSLMNGTPPREELHDKVVILGYDGERIPRLPTPIGPVKAHRVFCYSLFDLYRQLNQ